MTPVAPAGKTPPPPAPAPKYPPPPRDWPERDYGRHAWGYDIPT